MTEHAIKEAAELARRLREIGVEADGDKDDDAFCLSVRDGIRFLDFLLSATGMEHATALVIRLADFDCHSDEGSCWFCGNDVDGLLVAPRPHADDCLWELARRWKEEWA